MSPLAKHLVFLFLGTLTHKLVLSVCSWAACVVWHMFLDSALYFFLALFFFLDFVSCLHLESMTLHSKSLSSKDSNFVLIFISLAKSAFPERLHKLLILILKTLFSNQGSGKYRLQAKSDHCLFLQIKFYWNKPCSFIYTLYVAAFVL